MKNSPVNSRALLGGGAARGLAGGAGNARGLIGGGTFRLTAPSSKPKARAPEAPPPSPVEALEKVDKELTEIAKRQHTEADRRKLIGDSEFWVAICFESREQKDAWLAQTGLVDYPANPGDTGDKYLNGIAVAKHMGVDLSEKRVRFPRTNASSRLRSLTDESVDAEPEEGERRLEREE